MVIQTFERVLDSLARDKIKLEGEFLLGSNYTFLVRVHPEEDESFLAVYKPKEGERLLWDFPNNTLAHREVAAYLISQALEWNLVPPTVYRDDGPLGPGSVQMFIDHDPNYHYFNLVEEDFQRLRPLVLFDLVVNNADRKGGHIIFDENRTLWSIDHGLSFNQEEKLRTVIWDFAGERIPSNLRRNLTELYQKLKSLEGFLIDLQDHLSPQEIAELTTRANRVSHMTHFPHPPDHRRAFPYPPV
jgi:uncharacterized repeat protein (TIGR03843 family)